MGEAVSTVQESLQGFAKVGGELLNSFGTAAAYTRKAAGEKIKLDSVEGSLDWNLGQLHVLKAKRKIYKASLKNASRGITSSQHDYTPVTDKEIGDGFGMTRWQCKCDQVGVDLIIHPIPGVSHAGAANQPLTNR